MKNFSTCEAHLDACQFKQMDGKVFAWPKDMEKKEDRPIVLIRDLRAVSSKVKWMFAFHCIINST